MLHLRLASRGALAIWSACLFFHAVSAHAQDVSDQEPASTLNAKQAHQLRAWLAQGKLEKAWALLGERVWCQQGELVDEWDEQKNLSLAADLGVYARRAGKLDQAARCTLEASKRQGTLHQAAALYEASLLVSAMGVKGFAQLMQQASWFDASNQGSYCPSEPWSITPQQNISCALKLALKAPQAKQEQAARDYLLRSAASFAPQRAYLRALPKAERQRYVGVQLKAHQSVVAADEAQLWRQVRAKVYGGAQLKVPSCASLRRRGVEPDGDGVECRHFAKLIKKTALPDGIVVEAFEAGVNEYGTVCETSSNVYLVAYRKSSSGVRYVLLDSLGYTNGCGSGVEDTEVELVKLKDEPKSALVRSVGSSREGAMGYAEHHGLALCQQEKADGLSCLQGAWHVDVEIEHEDQPRSTRHFPLFAVKNGRIKLSKGSPQDFRFKEYDKLEGLTVEEAVAALPKIVESIQRRYVELVEDEPQPQGAK